MDIIAKRNNNDYVGINKSHFYLSIVAILVIVNLFFLTHIINKTVPDYVYPVVYEEEQTVNEENADDQNLQETVLPSDYEYVTVSQDDIHSGQLILVNYQNAYHFETSPSVVKKPTLVGMYEHKTKNFSLRDNAIRLNLELTEELAKMMDDFYAEKGIRNLMIISAYRTLEDQENTFKGKIESLGEEQGRLTAAEPGKSEHHTGYALDLNIYEKGESKTFDGKGEYSWFVENSWKYGFIERYNEGKTALTKITYEPWHYRYVGLCHAEYIYKNKLCYEEYIDLLRTYPFEGEHLNFVSYDGNEYEIYFVDVKESQGKVPVPRKENCEYYISGNNVDGIIVTEKHILTPQTPKESLQDTQE